MRVTDGGVRSVKRRDEMRLSARGRAEGRMTPGGGTRRARGWGWGVEGACLQSVITTIVMPVVPVMREAERKQKRGLGETSLQESITS